MKMDILVVSKKTNKHPAFAGSLEEIDTGGKHGF
jgi:hypothetical protein